MIKETRSWFERERAGRVVESLKRKGYDAQYFSSTKEAVSWILDVVSPDASIGFGGSMTLRETGIIAALQERGNNFITDPAESFGPTLSEQRRQALTCDVYLTSTNAISEDGYLVNIDGTGNRVASMVFGPRMVIVAAGMNKVTDTLQGAIERARSYAAVLNARRLECETPCAVTGKCTDCTSPDRICRILSILEACPSSTPVKVVLIGEELGF